MSHPENGVDIPETFLFADVIDRKAKTNNEIVRTTATSVVSFSTQTLVDVIINKKMIETQIFSTPTACDERRSIA